MVKEAWKEESASAIRIRGTGRRGRVLRGTFTYPWNQVTILRGNGIGLVIEGKKNKGKKMV